MPNPFFDHPILNSPYEYPRRHWELDEDGQPTQQIVEFHTLLGKASPKTLGFRTVPTMPTAGFISRFALIFR